MGVLKVARRLGIRVPDQLSLVGFDNEPGVDDRRADAAVGRGPSVYRCGWRRRCRVPESVTASSSFAKARLRRLPEEGEIPAEQGIMHYGLTAITARRF